MAVTGSIALNFGLQDQYRITDSITLCCWANLSSSSTFPCLISRGILNAGDSYCLYQNNSNQLCFGFCYGAASGSRYIIVYTPTIHGVLHHFAGVRDRAAGKMYIYVDGVPVVDTNVSSTLYIYNGTVPLYVGNNSRPLSGIIFDARVYNRALSAAEIAGICGARGCDNVLDSSLVLRTCINNGYAWNSLTGQTVYDHSTFKNQAAGSGSMSVAEDPYGTVKSPLIL